MTRYLRTVPVVVIGGAQSDTPLRHGYMSKEGLGYLPGGKDLASDKVARREREWEELLSLNWDLEEMKRRGEVFPDRIIIVAGPQGKGHRFEVTRDDFIHFGPSFRALTDAVRGVQWDAGRIGQVSQLIGEGLTNEEIAEVLGTTEGAVKSGLHRAQERGFEVPPRRVDPDKLLELFKQGVTAEDASHIFNVSTTILRDYERRFRRDGRLPPLDDPIPARNNFIAELSEKGYTAKQIVEELKTRMPGLNVNLKIIEHVRDELIREGKIQRHPRGGMKRVF